MKFSKSILILSTAGLGLTLAYSQQSNSEAQQKALDILHQQLAGQDKAAPAPASVAVKPAAGTPTREQLLADVERLHNDGKISDQQYAAFKKNINDQYSASASTSQSQALAQQALAQKIQQLKAGPAAAAAQPVVTQTAPKAQPAVQSAAAVASTTEAQAKAQKALDAQMAQQKANQTAKAPPPAKVAKAPAPQPAPAVVAAPVVVAAAAPPRTVERTNVIPATAYSTLSAQQEAQAREALRQKIAEANSQTVQPKPAAQAATGAVAPAPRSQSAPVAAAPPRTVAVMAEPAPGSGGPAAAVAVLREYEIGIPPGTPELVRILRVKVAELDGIITPEEAARIPLATKFYGPSPWAVAATSPKTEIPVATSNKEGLARLSELNYQYRANLISPADYHMQRAKIVATL